MTAALAARPEADILAFGRHLAAARAAAYTGHLWAAAYVLNGGCSDDGFEYFAGWLISKGQAVFEKAIAEPDSLARVVTPDEAGGLENERLLYCVSDAYSQRTGKSDYYDLVPHALPELTLDWEEEREDLARIVPKLVAKFWESE